MQKEKIEILELINEVFNINQSGRILLDKLKDMFFGMPVSPPGAKEGYGYFREGQNDMLRFFEKSIHDYKTLKENQK